jgi:hypothetical protein
MTRSALSRAVRVPNLARLALAAAVSTTGAFVVAGDAQAATPRNAPVTTTITLPGDRFCGFDVTMTTVDKSAQTPKDPKLLPPEGMGPNGHNFTGNEVVTFSANGKSQTFNVSGATHATTNGNIETEIHTGPISSS